MDVLRYTNPMFSETEQFKIIKAPSLSQFDDTFSSNKDQGNLNFNDFNRVNSGVPSPKDDIVINFTTTENPNQENPTTTAGVNTVEGHLLSRVTTMGHGAGDQIATTLADDQELVNSIDDTVLLRMISNLMFYILRINTISLILSGLLTLTIIWDVSYLYPLGFLWAVDFFELLQMLKHSRKRKNNEGIMKRVWDFLSPITKTIAYAGSKGLIVLYVDYPLISFSLLLCLAPISVYEIVNSVSSVMKSKQKTIKKAHMASLTAKALVILLGVNVILKLEGQVVWNWREVFLSYWILFGVLCGITVVAFLCVLNRCCLFFFADSDQYSVHGVLWAFFIIGGKTSISCLLILSARRYLENHASLEIFVSPFFFVMTYNLIMLLFTLGYYNEIENFLKNVTVVQDDIEVTQTQFETKENKPKRLQKIVVPKFLTKSSSTYYRISTDNEVKEVKDRRKKKQAQAKAKLKGKVKLGESESDKECAKEQAKIHDQKKRIARAKQKSVDYTNLKQTTSSTLGGTISSPKNPNTNALITIAETDQDKATFASEIDKKSTGNKSQIFSKGKDFFSGITNRTGVLGIVPSVARRLGFDGSGKKGYQEQEDDGHEDDHNGNHHIYGNLSYDVGRRPNPLDWKKDDGNGMHLRKTGRDELKGNGLEEIEGRLQRMEGKGKENKLSHSLYHPQGNFNISGMAEHSNDSSMVEDANKQPSAETSMTGQCLICFDKAPDAVFMDCGHGGVCYDCAVEIWKAAQECYLCRNKIIQVLQIDLKSKLGNDVIKVLSSTQMINWEEA